MATRCQYWLAPQMNKFEQVANLGYQLSLAGAGFPLRLENLEKWERIFQSGKSQGILNRLEKSGKITTNTDKYYLLFFGYIYMNCVSFANMNQIF